MMSQILSERLILSAANSKAYTLVVCEAYSQGIFRVIVRALRNLVKKTQPIPMLYNPPRCLPPIWSEVVVLIF